MPDAIDWAALEAQARASLECAYAPYSGFRVAAALLSADGRVFTGVNVENASYGLTTCAERNAIAAAIAAGVRRFAAILITCSGPRPPAPCGACRQVLAEFPPEFAVRSVGQQGAPLDFTTRQLLPAAFGPSDLED